MKSFELLLNEFYKLHSIYMYKCTTGIVTTMHDIDEVEKKEFEAVKAFFYFIDSNKKKVYEDSIKGYINDSIQREDYNLAKFILDLLEKRRPKVDLSDDICKLIRFLIKEQPVSAFVINIIERLVEILRFYKNPIIVPTLALIAKAEIQEQEVSFYAIRTMNLLSLIGNNESKEAIMLFKKSPNEDIVSEVDRFLS